MQVRRLPRRLWIGSSLLAAADIGPWLRVECIVGGESIAVSRFPAFMKLRWRGGMAPDAKAYLMVRIE